MSSAGRAALVGIVLLLTGCPGFGEREGPGGLVVEVPEAPVYLDVEPVLATYCYSCHSSPPAGGAPDSFRLDLCDDDEVLGARSQARRIVARIAESPGAPMPPFGAAPAGLEVELLQAWEESGAPCE